MLLLLQLSGSGPHFWDEMGTCLVLEPDCLVQLPGLAAV